MKLLPDEKYETLFDIPFEKLKGEGIKYILLDYDDTITSKKNDKPNSRTIELIDKLKKDFEVIIFSNNFKKRVIRSAEFLNVDYVSFALKPFKKNYKKLFKKKHIFLHEVCAIGDKTMTDILGGNNMKIKTIKIKKCNKKGWVYGSEKKE